MRKYAEAQDWNAAMRTVNREAARAPQDMEVRAWRARVLGWSGQVRKAEEEYLQIVRVAPNDPDVWMGLGNLYLREGRTQDALRALERAVEIDPKRADLHVARGRALRAAGERNEARSEFQKGLKLDRTSAEAQAGLISLRGEPKHELRFGQDNDLFNFASANRGEWTSLASHWTPHWTTNAAGSFYRRVGVEAGKFLGSVTGHGPKWGALTVGGGAGDDNAVIPRSEAFFEMDHAWKTSETNFARAVEFSYGQHWYWYATSRILALNGTATMYLAGEWTLSLGATGARSTFSGTGAEWRPSGVTRLGFPLAVRGVRRLSGNAFYAAGTENFGQVDQIGSFASQTYGGGLRFQFTERQDVTGYAGYQKRTQNRTDTSFGFSYGLHF